ncbi:MAG TPA: DNA translocase FtsK 4TM domain-containing protein [Acetobacteraceae bacterium]|nr:DNA translocase FtsK 4TM domain-containing protein [Acetobacteraceae bacterium]
MAAAQSMQSLASPAIKALIRRRLTELGGLALGLAAIALLLALVSYDPRDPSLDTASGAVPHNLAGPVGAWAADLLLQGFGLAAALPGLAMLAWAWRVGSQLGLARPGLRIIGVAVAMPAVAAVLGAITLQAGPIPWPVAAGLGGAMGQLIGGSVLAAGQGLLGPLGLLLGWAMLAALAASSGWLALGLSNGEWQAAGRGAADAARVSARHGWRVVALARRLARRPAKAPEPEPIANLLAEVDAASGEEFPLRREPRLDSASARPPRVAPRRAAPPPRQESLPLDDGFRFPSLALLKPAPARATTGPSVESLQGNARLLESVLGDYGVQGAIVEIRPGPVVTLYELEPAPGIRSARVIGLADDIARSLSVTAVRIATVPGRNVIGIEVPNSRRETVFLAELLASDDWAKHPARLALALGKDISGAPVVADLARMPHLLIAGTTGSGKSVGVNAMILSLLYRMPPDQCRMILIDPKMLELSVYEGIPHLMAPVVTEPAKAVTALKWTVREMERRYRSMSQLGVRNIGGYNERVVAVRAKGEVVTRRVQTGFDAETGRPMFEEQPLVFEPLPFIVVVIDEMADLMMVAGKDIEAAVQRLAQMARAAGIHVIMATQRPSVDVITGTIKANFPTRISFQVISKFDSRTILGEQGSEQLLGQGDMLYMMGGGRITRVHGPFVSDAEVEAVVEYLREQGEPAYIEEITEADEDDSGPLIPGLTDSGPDGERGLYEQAVSLVAREGKASTSFIQRHLQIGYNRAARLIEQMEKDGVVGPANHVGKREVLLNGRADA